MAKTAGWRRLNKHPHGCYDGTTVSISIMRRPNVAKTYLHEIIHREQPRLSEDDVVAEAKRRWRRMDNYQRYMLYREIFLHKFVQDR